MSRKVLGRGLGDLLHRARPARVVDRATTPDPAGANPSLPGLDPAPPPVARTDLPQSLRSIPDSTPTRPGAPDPSPVAGPAPRPAPPEPDPASKAPRFGPAYTPPPQPSEAPGRGLFYLILGIDLLLVVFAGAMAFGPWIERPLSLYLAAAAVLVGGTLACGAIAYQAAPGKPSAGTPKPSRVRVRLTRL